jgi:hypothetical protein
MPAMAMSNSACPAATLGEGTTLPAGFSMHACSLSG